MASLRLGAPPHPITDVIRTVARAGNGSASGLREVQDITMLDGQASGDYPASDTDGAPGIIRPAHYLR